MLYSAVCQFIYFEREGRKDDLFDLFQLDVIAQVDSVFLFELLHVLNAFDIFIDAVDQFKDIRFASQAIFQIIQHGLPFPSIELGF